MRGYIPPANDEERLFCKRTAELAQIVGQRGGARWTPFCTDREQVLAEAALAKAGCTEFCWEGGWSGAERRMLCVHSGQTPAAPLTALHLVSKDPRAAKLTHRDYLGSLMALGIKREALGDILPKEDGAILFATSAAAGLISRELVSIGRCAVSVTPCVEEALPQAPTAVGETQQATVASLRADSVLAAMLHLSRGTAAKLIAAHAVAINHIEVTSTHFEVNEGDVFSVKGKGKYRLCSIEGKSRKDRLFVSFVSY